MMNKPTGKQSHYQIIVEGQLDPCWQEWFDGLTITITDAGHTVLSGPIRDQAALHGLMKKVRNLGLPLLSVNRIEPDQKDENFSP